MTQCPNGSQPKADAGLFVWLSWSAFIAWVITKLGRFGTSIGVFFGDSPLDVSVFCASEPEIRTEPTLGQWLAFFTLEPTSKIYVEGYLLDCFRAFIWPTVCECLPSTGTGSTCNYGYASYPHTFANTTSLPSCRWYAQEFSVNSTAPVYGARIYSATAGLSFQVYLWDATNSPNTPVAGKLFTSLMGDNLYFFDTPYSAVSGNAYRIGYQISGTVSFDSSLTRTNTALVNYGDVAVSTVCSQITVPTTYDGRSWPVEPIICTGGPPSGAPIPFVPPDPVDPTDIPDPTGFSCSTTADICARLNQLQIALLETKTTVNWLQSALAPTCWVPGTQVTSLTGAGTIAVADVVGAYVTLTYPSAWGRTEETPPRLIPKAGELQFAVDGVPASEHQLHYDAEQVLGAPNASNSIIYNFRMGIVGAITPLQRCK